MDPVSPTDWKLVAISGGAIAAVTVMFLLAIQGAGRAAKRRRG